MTTILSDDELAERDRAYALLLRRQHVQKFAHRHERPANSVLEKLLWKTAKLAPFGGQIIPPVGPDPYLMRIYLTADGARIHLPIRMKREVDYLVGQGARPYLHYFFRGDGDRDFHNHPWSISYSWILAGGYTEHRWDAKAKEVRTRIFRPGSFNVIRRDDYHWVKLLDPEVGCWTLFLTVDRLHKSDGTDWGFLDVETGVYTPWGEYNARKAVGPSDAG